MDVDEESINVHKSRKFQTSKLISGSYTDTNDYNVLSRCERYWVIFILRFLFTDETFLSSDFGLMY